MFDVPPVLVVVGFLIRRDGAIHRVQICWCLTSIIWCAWLVFPFASTEAHASGLTNCSVSGRSLVIFKNILFCNGWIYWAIFPSRRSSFGRSLSYFPLTFFNLISIKFFNFFIVLSDQLELFLFQSFSVLNSILLFQLLNEIAKFIACLIDFLQIAIQSLKTLPFLALLIKWNFVISHCLCFGWGFFALAHAWHHHALFRLVYNCDFLLNIPSWASDIRDEAGCAVVAVIGV